MVEQRKRGLYKPHALRGLRDALKAQERGRGRPGQEGKGSRIDSTVAGIRLNCDERFGIGLEH